MFIPKFSTCYDSFIGLLIRNSFHIIQYTPKSGAQLQATLLALKDIAPEMFDTNMREADLCKKILVLLRTSSQERIHKVLVGRGCMQF